MKGRSIRAFVAALGALTALSSAAPAGADEADDAKALVTSAPEAFSSNAGDSSAAVDDMAHHALNGPYKCGVKPNLFHITPQTETRPARGVTQGEAVCEGPDDTQWPMRLFVYFEWYDRAQRHWARVHPCTSEFAAGSAFGQARIAVLAECVYDRDHPALSAWNRVLYDLAEPVDLKPVPHGPTLAVATPAGPCEFIPFTTQTLAATVPGVLDVDAQRTCGVPARCVFAGQTRIPPWRGAPVGMKLGGCRPPSPESSLVS